MRISAGTLVALILALSLAACGGGGGAGGSGSSNAPTPVITASAHAPAAAATPSSMPVSVGSAVTLDAGSSSAASGRSIASFSWTIGSAPAGSTAKILNAVASNAIFTPDIVGAYQLNLTVTDSSGAAAATSMALYAMASVPLPSVTIPVSFPAATNTNPAQNAATGTVVTLDGSGASYPTGTAVVLSYQLAAVPTGSQAALTVSGATASFAVDTPGQYQIHVHGQNASAAADSYYVIDATAAVPTVSVAAGISTSGGSATLKAGIGNLVSLSASASSLPAGDPVTTSWSVTAPAGSAVTQLVVPSAASLTASLVPDVAGSYVVTFQLKDVATGALTAYTINLTVVAGPAAVVTGSVVPVPSATGPSFVTLAGAPVTMRGTGSYDPSGGNLTYAWTLASKPTGSTAALSAATTPTATFTPDLAGTYVVQLTVTSSASGLSASETVNVNVGHFPPVVILDRVAVTLNLGGTATASAASSYDVSGQTLTFNWSIDSKPAGSAAVIAAPGSSALNFTPDVAGTYFVSVTVSDGQFSSVGSVNVIVVGAAAGPIPLGYTPLQTKFSKSLGRLIIVSATPDLLHVLDPVSSTDTPVALPAPVKSLQLSPDGTLAAVLHEGLVSLIDLRAGTLLHTASTGGSQTDAFVGNSGLIYPVGQTGGQWVTPAFTVVDGRTGNTIQSVSTVGNVYGTTKGIYSAVAGKIFTLSEGLSPAQIYDWPVDATSGALSTTTGSPYWGDYAMYDPFWLSSDESLLYTAPGTYFHTSDLTYAGTLGVSVSSLSHSAAAGEVVALQTSSTYPNVYKRWTTPLLTAAPDVPLATIGSAAAYGLTIFHMADNRHAMVVQTGSATPLAAGVNYYVVIQ